MEVYARHLKANGNNDIAESAILRFLNWDTANEETFGQDVRLVLVSAEFSKEITTSVIWLNDHGLDIRCVRLRPYALDSRVVLDVQQIIPLPEANDITIQLKKKAQESRIARKFDPDFSKFTLTVDGNVKTGLTKRGLALEVVGASKRAVARASWFIVSFPEVALGRRGGYPGTSTLRGLTTLSADEIDLARTNSGGVAALKIFLTYAATGKIDVPMQTQRPQDSIFEEQV